MGQEGGIPIRSPHAVEYLLCGVGEDEVVLVGSGGVDTGEECVLCI